VREAREKEASMSGFGYARQGCSIRPVFIDHTNTSPFNLRKVSEIGFTGEAQQVAQMPTWLRAHGVQIGIQIPPGHQIVNDDILFGVGTVDGPLPTTWVTVHEDPAVTQVLRGLFAQTGLWRGFDLPDTLIPASTAAKPEDERFYTDITFRNFRPKQKLDFYMVPIVFVLRGVGFNHHYILGASIFTSGWRVAGDVDDFWTSIEAVPRPHVLTHDDANVVPPEDPKLQAP
jgi:hypothetical protein